MRRALVCFAAVFVMMVGVWSVANASPLEDALGGLLYFDRNLSNPAGQSCADCHLPSAGFADPDRNLPVSEGVIPGRFGGRNAPSAAYASFSPDFYFNEAEGLWMGGQFWDGRALDLEEQARGPFLNPVEMNNTKQGVINAVRRSSYAWLFKLVYGKNSLNNVETAYVHVSEAIAAFERTKLLNSFTSKYDYYLKGKVALSAQELRGLDLFNDPLKGNCAACHPGDGPKPLFTDFSYDNLGIPKNAEIEALVGAPVPIDYGLGNTVGMAEDGKFKVSSLRNLAKTAPYGHNGYFKDLKTIVHFYNTRDVESWPLPEVNNENVNRDELGNLGLTSAEEDDIVAFLGTLTDGYKCKGCY
ncbi:MAG: cytochrome c peroxidase [Thermodesulfobacteriota bacterium]